MNLMQAVVHAVRQHGLGVQRIGHVDAFTLVRLNRPVDNISCLRQGSHEVQNVQERHASDVQK
jgi:hypothetical protein